MDDDCPFAMGPNRATMWGLEVTILIATLPALAFGIGAVSQPP